MKKIKYLLFALLVFICISTSAKALTKVELIGDSEIEYGSLVTYQIKLSTDENIEGFQFDLDYDKNLTYVTIQSLVDDLTVKISDNKDRIIGYGTTMSDQDIVATIIFQTADFSKTTSVDIKLSNEIYTNENLATIKNTDTITATTNVVVPEVDVSTTSSTNTTSQDEKKSEENKVVDKVLSDDEKSEEKGITKVIKIIIIILLGAFILYLLNKEEKTEEDISKEEEKEKETKKSEVKKKETKKAKK